MMPRKGKKDASSRNPRKADDMAIRDSSPFSRERKVRHVTVRRKHLLVPRGKNRDVRILHVSMPCCEGSPTTLSLHLHPHHRLLGPCRVPVHRGLSHQTPQSPLSSPKAAVQPPPHLFPDVTFQNFREWRRRWWT